MANTRSPISAIESDLIEVLEFVRVAVSAFPKATDRILTVMDLSDEAFREAIDSVCAAVDFDFNDNGEDDNDD